MNRVLSEVVDELKRAMEQHGVVPETGLGTELFLFASTLMPVVNVDLLIFDRQGRVLLSWRDDPHVGTGWHVPGRCVRFQETLGESIDRCAQEEIGTHLRHSAEPIKVYEFHWDEHREALRDQRERAHFITLVYRCLIPDGYKIGQNETNEKTPGSLKWFDGIPDDILPLQKCYQRDWEELKHMGA